MSKSLKVRIRGLRGGTDDRLDDIETVCGRAVGGGGGGGADSDDGNDADEIEDGGTCVLAILAAKSFSVPISG